MKINKSDYIRVQKLLESKENYQKNSQPTEREKIFINYINISNKG